MTIESALARIADALEKATTATPVIVKHHDDTKVPSQEPADPQQAATMEPDHEETVPVDNSPDDRTLLQKAIGQLIQTETGTDQARAILKTFHGAQKIAELEASEYSQVTAKMNAAYLSLDS